MAWVTDYDDFDEIVVVRLTAGDAAGEPIRAAEAAEAVRRLAALGYHDGQIALRLGFTRRSVLRIRERRNIPAALPCGGNQHTAPVAAPTRPRMAG